MTAQQIKLGPPLVLASGYPFFDLGCGFLYSVSTSGMCLKLLTSMGLTIIGSGLPKHKRREAENLKVCVS